ncbi:SDR family oxidoreductase [Streptomyces sp. FXJ1.4098]|nr:SDR family oxidoreductase [Streptomyces sp. FXJ1.4098]
MRVVVTGGGRGIGRAVALGFAARGARVAVLARTESQVKSVAGEIEELGTESVAVAVDVADEAAMGEAAEQVVDRFGGLDVLVNAAGVFDLGPTIGFPVDSARTLLDTNVVGTFLACKIFGRHLLEQGHGKVVNFCSLLSYTAFPERALYAASKGGVLQLTRSLGWSGRRTTSTSTRSPPA